MDDGQGYDNGCGGWLQNPVATFEVTVFAEFFRGFMGLDLLWWMRR